MNFKTVIITLLMAATLPAVCQEGIKDRKRPITELVSNLSAQQKKKIDNLTQESKNRVNNLRKAKNAACDSIELFMAKEGNQSAVLNKLFQREADLQVAINREMYTTKVKVDEVLTKEQRAELRKATQKDGQKCHHRH